jgi:hypothetical protein
MAGLEVDAWLDGCQRGSVFSAAALDLARRELARRSKVKAF